METEHEEVETREKAEWTEWKWCETVESAKVAEEEKKGEDEKERNVQTSEGGGKGPKNHAWFVIRGIPLAILPLSLDPATPPARRTLCFFTGLWDFFHALRQVVYIKTQCEPLAPTRLTGHLARALGNNIKIRPTRGKNGWPSAIKTAESIKKARGPFTGRERYSAGDRWKCTHRKQAKLPYAPGTHAVRRGEMNRPLFRLLRDFFLPFSFLADEIYLDFMHRRSTACFDCFYDDWEAGCSSKFCLLSAKCCQISIAQKLSLEFDSIINRTPGTACSKDSARNHVWNLI